jgi:hypothetical protein
VARPRPSHSSCSHAYRDPRSGDRAETGARLNVNNSDGVEELALPLSRGELARALGSVPLYVQRELDGLAEARAIEVSAME